MVNKKPTILLIHGLTSSSAAFDLYKAQFSKNYNVVVIDYKSSVNYVTMKRQVDAHIQHYDPQIVVGHSMGGIIASDLYDKYDFELITINSAFTQNGYNITSDDDILSIPPQLLNQSDETVEGGHSLTQESIDAAERAIEHLEY